MTRYGRLGASSRQRCLIYRDALRAAGIAAEIHPFLSDAYLCARYDGRPVSPAAILRSYGARLRALLRLSRYDLVWIEKEALPWLPAAIEIGFFRTAGTRVVVDYDDAVFHTYDRHRNILVRALLGAKIDRVMKAADLVIAGNAYLADRARAAGARHIAELPTVVDLRRYSPTLPCRKGGSAALTIGWIGSPLTSAYLDLLRPALIKLMAQIPLRLLLVGAAPTALAGFPVERVAWSAESEAAEIARCDVGVMPLPDQPFERGKCGYKLIQFMAGARPVVASPVGANCTLIIPGKTGFLAEEEAEWVAALARLYHDPDLRGRMGQAGRRRVEDSYALAVAAPRLVALLRRTARAEL
ncbi:MAG: glycosyltransferase [Stellaceae bacterium]